MTGSDRNQASSRLSRWLTTQTGSDVTVADLDAVSAGARRFNAIYCEHCKIVNSLRPHDDSDSVNSVTRHS